MKRKILLSALIIALVGGGGYAASQALFTDTETGTDSSFTVGTLDMDIDGNNGDSAAFDNFEVTNIGADGTVSGGKTWTINNKGTLPGNLTLALASLINNENGCNEPEEIVDATCDDPGPDQGELGNAMSVTVLLDQDGAGGADPVQVVAADLATANQATYAAEWNTNAGTVTIPAGGSVDVTMNWETSPADYGNEIQSDSLGFDVNFVLEQVTPSN